MMLTLTNASTPSTAGADLSPESNETPARDDSHATLLALLDEGLGMRPEYRAQLSSHLPMALDALQQLGASSARLREFNAHYGVRLQPMPTKPSAAERPLQFGRIDDYPQWFAHYRAALAADGRDTLLRTELPALMAGVGGVAFHGMIRTGHAVRHGHEGELAAALAYWASRHQPLPEPSDTRPLALPDWLAALRALPSAEATPKRGLISERMADWGARPDWQSVAARLPATELPALARAAAMLYAATANFTVLHMVTASAALLSLRPWLDDSLAYPHFISAAAAALMASGAVRGTAALAPVDEAVLPGWAALAAGAIAQHDDHVIKLVAACHVLEVADSAPVWHAAAARALWPTEPQAP